MANDIIVLTGCSSGLGIEITRKLLNSGNVVLGIDRESISDHQITNNSKFRFLNENLENFSHYQSLISAVENEYSHIDVLINNAAIQFPARFDQVSEDQLDSLMNINFKAPYFLFKNLLPLLNRSESCPHVFNISSPAAKFGAPYLSPYVSSKSALHGLTLSINEEFRFYGKVKASTIYLTNMNTPMSNVLQGWPGLSRTERDTTVEPVDIAEFLLNLLQMRHLIHIDSVYLQGRRKNNDRPLINPLFSIS